LYSVHVADPPHEHRQCAGKVVGRRRAAGSGDVVSSGSKNGSRKILEESFLGNSSSSCCTCGGRAATAAVVSELQGLIKGVVLALVKVRPEAPCRTCCLDGIIESSNLA
jgi:hypothetical protein